VVWFPGTWECRKQAKRHGKSAGTTSWQQHPHRDQAGAIGIWLAKKPSAGQRAAGGMQRETDFTWYSTEANGQCLLCEAGSKRCSRSCHVRPFPVSPRMSVLLGLC